MDQDQEKKTHAQEQDPALPTASAVVLGLLALAFAGIALIIVKNLAKIVFVGEICYKRGGCHSWSSGTWSMVGDLLFHVILLLILVSKIVAICAVLSKGTKSC